MKFERTLATLVSTGHSVQGRSAVRLRRFASALFISVVLSGLAAAQTTGCPLNSPGGNISHIVYIQFDNVHFERDNPNVPSDLEQLPNLMNFLTSNGTLYTNHHTSLISHTADGILTSLTGVYGDRHGQAVANGFVSRNLPSNKFWDEFPSSFTYWTDQVETNATEDTAFSMITAQGLNAPAPWVPFTRLGCDVGAVSIANMELENVTSDITNVFGATSPESKETTAQKTSDFEGIAIHCAQNTACATFANNKPDLLPSEPGGYTGFTALYGHKYVVPFIAPSGLNDLSGNPITGFPGFTNISPAQALAYDAQMLESGIPVIFTYISDAHDCHNAVPCTPASRAFGPGEAGYVQQLQAYNTAFGEFFARLAVDGIDKTNTLFVVTADEQDHFAGGPAAPVGCDGVTTPCIYEYPAGSQVLGEPAGPDGNQLSTGEVEADLAQLYQQQFPNLIPSASAAVSGLSTTAIFDYHFDMAPAVYLDPFNPANTPAFARQLERATAQLTGLNPITNTTNQLTNYLVDNAGLNALHMITGDPNRTPTFVMFANPDWFFQTQTPLIQQSPGFAWNHGGVATEINRDWLGMVGPGVKNTGMDNVTWSDETDIRPTLLYLTGVTDDYQSDGRVLVENLETGALPAGLQSNPQAFEQLAAAYKQMTAPVGAFGQATLRGSTVALASGNTTNDSQYTAYVNRLTQLTAQRNALVSQIKTQLNAVEFQGAALNPATADSLAAQAELTVLDINASSASFGQQSVGTAAPVQTLSYSFADPVTLSAVNILTAGTAGLDYIDGGSSTCIAGTAYKAGQSCVVTVAFTPRTPGLRSGAVTLYTEGSNVPLTVWYLNGMGQSGAVTIDAGTQSTLGTLANNGQANGAAIDGAGNVYVADKANSQVLKLAVGTFTSSTVIASGLSNPTALALDGAGNLYISDTGNNRVVIVPNEQGTLNSADVSTVTIPGLGSPSGLAIDGSGNLYVVDTTNADVLEIPTGNGAPVVLASGLTGPSGVVVDATGNVYVSTNNQVTEYPTGGGTPIPIGSGFNNPSGLAVDASGAVYVADSGNSRIVRVAPGGASQAALPGVTVANPNGVAIDSSANVYITAAGSVYEINRTQAAALTFAAAANSVSPPQTVTVSNAGNQPLNISNVAATANFLIVPSGGTDCTSSAQLASSLQCLVAVEFAPTTSGTQTGTLTLTNNALNNPASTQTVQLSGGAAQLAQTITFTGKAPSTAPYNSSFTVVASATSGLPVTYTSSGSCTDSGATYTITSGTGTCTVTASQAGNGAFLAATPVSEVTTAQRANQAVTFTGAPALAQFNSTFVLTATTNASGTAFITGTNPTVCSLSGSFSPVTVTILKDAGKCTFTASWGADGNYNPATATQTSTAARGTPVITWVTPAPITYGTPLSSTQLDATANVAGAFTYSAAIGRIENVGSTTLKATFKPTSTDFAVTTDTVNLQVLQAATTTTITSSSPTVKMNIDGVASAVLDFDVTSYKPMGAVTLTASTGEVCTGVVAAATGKGSCKLTLTTTGARTITAAYSGDSNHLGSNSAGQNPAVTVTVNPH